MSCYIVTFLTKFNKMSLKNLKTQAMCNEKNRELRLENILFFSGNEDQIKHHHLDL